MQAFAKFEEKYPRVWEFSFYLILALGIFLRSYQYLMGRFLWEDEAHLALNFITRNYSGLLQPLDYLQAAPPLFLWSVKTFTLIFGYGEKALRGFPFLMSLIALPCFYFVLVELVRSRIIALAGFFAFAVNLSLIYFSSELKTYSLDVSAYLILTFLAVSQNSIVVARKSTLLVLVAIFFLLCSNITAIILASLTGYMALTWWEKRGINGAEVKALVLIVLTLAVYYFAFVHKHPYAESQRANYAFAFPPQPIFGQEFMVFMSNCVREIAFDLLMYISHDLGFGWVFLFFLILAIITAVIKKHYRLLIICCLPMLMHFFASVFSVYPFWYRFILYFIPALIILSCYGILAVVNFLSTRLHYTASLILIIFCTWFLSIESIRRFPLWYREIGPVISEINKRYSKTPLFITTPHTLYKYYNMTGVARNSQYEGLQWNIAPDKFFASVAGTNENYALLHAEDFAVDGYKSVVEELQKRNLLVRQFRHMTYVLSEIRPEQVDSNTFFVNYRQFQQDNTFELNGQKVIAIWGSGVSSKPVLLSRGSYNFTLIAKGTAVANEYPHLNVFVSKQKVASFFAGRDFSPIRFSLEQLRGDSVEIRIEMDNDAHRPDLNEDRNAFIDVIKIRKVVLRP